MRPLSTIKSVQWHLFLWYKPKKSYLLSCLTRVSIFFLWAIVLFLLSRTCQGVFTKSVLIPPIQVEEWWQRLTSDSELKWFNGWRVQNEGHYECQYTLSLSLFVCEDLSIGFHFLMYPKQKGKLEENKQQSLVLFKSSIDHSQRF